MGRQQRKRRRLCGLCEAARGRGAESRLHTPPTRFSLTGRSAQAARACRSDRSRAKGIVAEDGIEFGDLDKKYRQSTFGAHFVEVGVDAATGESRVRRMLAVCAAGRILNPKSARSQVIGAHDHGRRRGADGGTRGGQAPRLLREPRSRRRYEVPVHADIPHQEVIFLDETDPMSSPLKAKGVGELGICGVGAAVANAIYNATGVRVRDYPITLDKLIEGFRKSVEPICVAVRVRKQT